jgi:uncharacterized protein YhfF
VPSILVREGSSRQSVVVGGPPIDPAVIAAFWQRAHEAAAIPADRPAPDAVEHFGDSAELADQLLALVLDGPKRATAGSLAAFERDGAPLPSVGDHWVVVDGAGRPRAVLRTTDVRVGPLSSVDDAFAWDEGEGDRTRASWLADHEAYFRRELASLGVAFEAEMPTVFERFEVVYSEEVRGS